MTEGCVLICQFDAKFEKFPADFLSTKDEKRAVVVVDQQRNDIKGDADGRTEGKEGDPR